MSKHPSADFKLLASIVAFGLVGALSACGPAETSATGLVNAGQGVAVSVAPSSATVSTGAQQAFAATVTGTAETAVTWAANCGTITTAGLFTAPTTVTTCSVTATSKADSTKSASATVTTTSGGTSSGSSSGGSSSGGSSGGTTGDTVWAPLKVGAGGWITGFDVCTAGTTYVLRTDTYGAYVGNPNAGTPWQQLVRADAMPAAFMARVGDSLGEGAYEARVAPSDCNRLYMAYKKMVYKSTNRGATWAPTAFSYSGAMDPNDGYRTWGQKMAVDPANPDVVYQGTVASGLFVTTNGGTSWSAVSGVPASTHGAGITGIAFDPSSGTTSGRTNTIYAAVNGAGVYRSTNAGVSWSLLSGGPTTVEFASVAADGVYYAVNMGTSVYKYAGGAWSTSASTGVTLHTISTDPFNAARIIAGRDSVHLLVSTDRGATWGTGVIWGPSGQMARKATAPDVTWLANANESYMSSGAMRFDPIVQNKLWFTEGIGVWYSSDPANTTQTTWTAYSAGIEQLVGRDVILPPGSQYVYLAGMDRSVWRVDKSNAAYPASYLRPNNSTASLIAAWSVNYSAANPQHLVAIINHGIAGEPELSGYSTDNGVTWTVFPTQPGTGGMCGQIIAPSIDNIIAVIGTKYAYRSTNRGSSWTKLSLPGDSGADNNNLHAGYNSKKHILAIDGANPQTLYLYFYTHGVYRSTDGGATWALVNTSSFDGQAMYWQVKLRAVPGQAGHLFLSPGQTGGVGSTHPATTKLYRSTDGGTTWTTVPGFAETYDVALGKAATGQTYPAIYVVGWYNNVYGIWRSIDSGNTWKQIGPFPFNSVDEITRIAASLDTFGDVYVSFQGSGWGYGTLAK